MVETNTLPVPVETAPQDNILLFRAERREERKQAVIQFVRDHPGVTVAGTVAAGLIIGALLPRRPVRKLTHRSVELAEIVSAATALIGRNAIEGAQDASHKLGRRSRLFANRAEKSGAAASHKLKAFGEDAGKRVGKWGSRAGKEARRAGGMAMADATVFGRKAARSAVDAEKVAAKRLDAFTKVTSKRLRKAEKVARKEAVVLGDAAAERWSQVSEAGLSALVQLLSYTGARIERAGRRIRKTASDVR